MFILTGSTEKTSLITPKYDRGNGACNNQVEGGEKDTVFVLEDGATLRNVIIGKHQAEGIYCKGYVFLGFQLCLKDYANYLVVRDLPLTDTVRTICFMDPV